MLWAIDWLRMKSKNTFQEKWKKEHARPQIRVSERLASENKKEDSKLVPSAIHIHPYWSWYWIFKICNIFLSYTAPSLSEVLWTPNFRLQVKKVGSTEIWTRIAGFKVQSANHYTIEPGPTRMGFEPTRAEPNGLAVHRLNHSATSSSGRRSIK